MKYCIMSWDPKRFDIQGCLDEFGFVDWCQFPNVSNGDIVFMYGKKPFGQIGYMFQVIANNINYDDTIDDSKYSLWGIEPAHKYCRLKLLAIAPDGNKSLSYETIKKHGVKSTLQRGVFIPESLSSFFISQFDVVPSSDGSTFVEGSLSFSMQSHYERNPYARKACLSVKGYSCTICDFDFEKTYGQVGRNFIHVHHVTPLSTTQGNQVKTDPLKDLIPVCPNCHSMLHRKFNGKYLSPAELKNLISK